MIDWLDEIAKAKHDGKFSDAARLRSKFWATCAVGEMRERYGEDVVVYTDQYVAVVVKPGGNEPLPEDKEMKRLGGYYAPDEEKPLGFGFHGAVCNNDFDRAEEVYHRIEDRAIQLKREKGTA